MKRSKKRVNVTIPVEYYEQISGRGLNLSGLITDLLGDHFAGTTITIRVEPETKRLYDQVVANTGHEDSEIEIQLRVVLESMLERKIGELENLRNKLQGNHV